jgi:hypothetical protein
MTGSVYEVRGLPARWRTDGWEFGDRGRVEHTEHDPENSMIFVRLLRSSIALVVGRYVWRNRRRFTAAARRLRTRLSS